MALFKSIRCALITTLFLGLSPLASVQALANDWVVVKMSGQVWLNADKPKKIALEKNQSFKQGDTLTTAKNGRVLLKRGKETILISPGTTIALPSEKPGLGKTRLLQTAGEILLDVEKKNVKHFEVQTQFLAAVVKGTQFRVKIDSKGTSVDVSRGKVEVKNLKTGKYVLVLPGQSARVSLGKTKTPSLSISGKGKLDKIKQGKPAKSFVKPGLNTKKLQRVRNQKIQKGKPGFKRAKATVKRNIRIRGRKTFRIGRALGPVKLNIAKATKGLSRSKRGLVIANRDGKKKLSVANTFWNSGLTTNDNSNGGNNGNGNGGNNGNGNGNGNNGSNNGNGGGLGLGLGNGGGNGGGLGLGLGIGGGNGNGLGLGLGNGGGNGNGNGNGK